MTGYRNIYRCPECKKVGAKKADLTNDDFNSVLVWLFGNNEVLCKHCGKEVKLERIFAKPRLFGLLGWDIKEKE